jgi:hypothetical protein
MDLIPYDLLFVKGAGFIGKTISKVSGSEYSHVAIVIDRNHLIETNWKYPLKIRHLTYRPNEFDVYRYHRPITEQEKHIMNLYLLSHLRDKYDFIQTLSHGLFLVGGVPIKNAENRLNCSETVDNMFYTAGIDLRPAKENGYVTPGDLSKSKYLRRVEQC